MNNGGGFPGGSVIKKKKICLPSREHGFNPWVGNIILWCSCLKSSMDRGDWHVTVHGVAKSKTQLSA